MMKKLLIAWVLSLIFGNILLAQGEIDDQQKVFFRNEKSFSISLLSDDFILGYRYGRRINDLNKTLYEVDFGTLKHPKEYKVSSYWVNTSFKFGKVNTAFYLRAGIGRQHEIFKKADLGGIAVRYFYVGVITLGMYKPIYYRPAEIIAVNDSLFYLSVGEGQKFNDDFYSYEDIYCRDKFTKGLFETKFLPGVYGKIGLNFEYSITDKAIHALEVGGQMNVFPKKMPIMAKDNKFIFPSLFISYRIGIIADPLSREKINIFKIFSKRSSIQEQ
ncbi:MAG: hypothetical protein J6W61_00220 [Bacteroidales bacterium]|nr:hypothetical protein [Bacteroidales bacterium]